MGIKGQRPGGATCRALSTAATAATQIWGVWGPPCSSETTTTLLMPLLLPTPPQQGRDGGSQPSRGAVGQPSSAVLRGTPSLGRTFPGAASCLSRGLRIPAAPPHVVELPIPREAPPGHKPWPRPSSHQLCAPPGMPPTQGPACWWPGAPKPCSVLGSRAVKPPQTLSIRRQRERRGRGHQPEGPWMRLHPVRSQFPASGTQGSCVVGFFPSRGWNFAECFVLDPLKTAPVTVNNSAARVCRGAVVAAASCRRGTAPASPELPKGCCSWAEASKGKFRGLRLPEPTPVFILCRVVRCNPRE